MGSESRFSSRVLQHMWLLASIFIIFAAVNSAFATKPEIIEINPAESILFTDFDNTFTQEVGGAWVTFWYLNKVTSLNNALQAKAHIDAETSIPFAELPLIVPVTYEEYLHYLRENVLASPGGGNGFVIGGLRSDTLPKVEFSPADRPDIWFPGYYSAEDSSTFKDYRPNIGGESHLIRDYKLSVQRSKKIKKPWKGWTFPIFQAFVNSGNENNVFIVTDRGQTVEEFHQFGAELANDGEFETYVGDVTIIPMHSNEGIKFGNGYLFPKKVEALQDVAGDYVKMAKRDQKKITLVVADDHPGYIDDLGDKLADLSTRKDYSQWLEFVLVNTASDTWRKGDRGHPAKYMHRAGVFRQGRYKKVHLQLVDSTKGAACSKAVK